MDVFTQACTFRQPLDHRSEIFCLYRVTFECGEKDIGIGTNPHPAYVPPLSQRFKVALVEVHDAVALILPGADGHTATHPVKVMEFEAHDLPNAQSGVGHEQEDTVVPKSRRIAMIGGFEETCQLFSGQDVRETSAGVLVGKDVRSFHLLILSDREAFTPMAAACCRGRPPVCDSGVV